MKDWKKTQENSDRKWLNNRKEHAEKFYKLFKECTAKEVKRRAGLHYLSIMRQIREIEKRLGK